MNGGQTGASGRNDGTPQTVDRNTNVGNRGDVNHGISTHRNDHVDPYANRGHYTWGHPSDRGTYHYDQFHHDPFYHHGNHYFGYRVHSLPPRYSVMHRWGRDYYYYNNVYYVYRNGGYYVSRPPVGILFTVKSHNFTPVTFRYYSGEDYGSLTESTTIARGLNLTQRYAYTGVNYYYEDGVFFRLSTSGYEVVAAPAGALVEQIPEDYQVINWYGNELYQVDDTVYRLVMIYGKPMLEVVGQTY